jgi:hypothetical protein
MPYVHLLPSSLNRQCAMASPGATSTGKGIVRREISKTRKTTKAGCRHPVADELARTPVEQRASAH